MGQAKRRGTFEQRLNLALERDKNKPSPAPVKKLSHTSNLSQKRLEELPLVNSILGVV